ncbi:hydroxymethylpyrimidine/phosphomethylpyrimidine kinase [Albidovulum inexpectatum]|uniref:hydroxymethylpyrimidine kinase n=1 Tax=Albidovulum inexpectatum TaxID=196587 RepID=A0A2S5JHR7_9RHOB|nr:hydroxymethylpyrimidine/phosphomethylpyrimidine kinase [Albidovulum inexpectatum]PPB80835.1 hydroxymethylpyrimidine/phosphomethylpyrimidine kinase [Albidovulum inexpectatum]
MRIAMTRVLFVGGTDSSGGAGLSRDVATAARLGAEAAIAVTAITAQNDRSVAAVWPQPADRVKAQILAAGPVGAVKTGMLADAAIVTALTDALPPAPLVVDPVLAASSGRALLTSDGLAALVAHILPRATLVTPNLPELALLARALGVGDDADDATRAHALLELGCEAVLVKGGHATGPRCTDRLYRTGAHEREYTGPRLATGLRGTGCRLASAIAVGLARGQDIDGAIRTARLLLAEDFARAAKECATHGPAICDG